MILMILGSVSLVACTRDSDGAGVSNPQAETAVVTLGPAVGRVVDVGALVLADGGDRLGGALVVGAHAIV